MNALYVLPLKLPVLLQCGWFLMFVKINLKLMDEMERWNLGSGRWKEGKGGGGVCEGVGSGEGILARA